MVEAPRVRIAPSPTGDPHVGTAYVALFNYVFARKHGGQFVLRIEDTDRARSTEGSEEAIIEALRWLGLDWDEGPDVGGPFGPYRQSERFEHYAAAAETLLASGAAYRCFCSSERVEQLRIRQRAEKSPFVGYDGHCRDLDPAEASRRAEAGEACVLRLRIRGEGKIACVDGLRGPIEFDRATQEDGIIVKSDGWPTYHLANIVDDHAMKITHVIRGEEWISSLPKHVALYAAFGWQAPEFLHLGLLKDIKGRKLSKRRNPVSIFHYRDLGYLPATFLNFLGTLGFSIAADRDRFTLDEMIEKFEWSRMSVEGGSVFDPVKLDAFNGDDIRAMDIDALQRCISERVLTPARIRGLLEQAQPRIARLDDFVPYVSFFFGGSVDYGPVQAKFQLPKRTRKQVASILERFLDDLETDVRARRFDAQGLEEFARALCESQEWKTKELFTLLRIAVTGRTAAPSLFDTLALCGKDRVRLRIRDAIEYVKRLPEW